MRMFTPERLPGRDCYAAPSFGLDVSHRLCELPAVAGEILDHARAFAVLVRGRLLEDAGSGLAGNRERCVHVRHSDLDQLRDAAAARRDLVAADVGHDDRTVLSDPKLRAVPIADPDTLSEAERSLEPLHRSAHVRVEEHRGDRRGRGGAVRQHYALNAARRSARRYSTP